MVQYALPVYNPAYLKINKFENIQLRIDENLFLETLLMRLRGETIKFASQLKKNQNAKEKQLIKEITDLEKSKNIFAVIDLLHDKKRRIGTIKGG